VAAGDFYIRRNNADTSAVPNAGGGNEDSHWDTEVKDVGGIVSYSDPDFQLDTGLYLIMYSERFNTTDTTNNERIEIQGEIHVSGTGVVGGYGQDYIRKTSQFDCIVSGAMILDVTADNTDVFIRFYRTDDSTTGTVTRVPGHGGVQILELDDNDNYAFYSTSSSEVTSGTTIRQLQIDTNDRQDTGFSRTGDTVTVTNAGRYLVIYNMDLSMTATSREEAVGFLDLGPGSSVVPGTYSASYIRGADGCQDGALCWIGIVDFAASDDFAVSWQCPTSATITAAAGATLQIWQIPSGGDEVIMEATTGDVNAPGDFDWDTLPHIDTASFTATAGNANIDVDQRDYVLAFATVGLDGPDTPQRPYPEWRFTIDDDLVNYAAAGYYHRNSGGAGELAINLAAILQPIPDQSIECNITTLAVTGAVNQDTGQFAMLSLESVFGPYTFDPIITDFNTTELFNWGDTNLVLSGDAFEATQGTGKVEFWSDEAGTIKTVQTIDTWAAGSIQIDTVQGSLPNDTTIYLVVTTDGGLESNKFPVNVGLIPYIEVVRSLSPDHYWPLQNSYDDDQGVNDMTTDISDGGAFVTTPKLADGDTHSWRVDAVTDRRGCADSSSMNIGTPQQERTMGGWIQLGGIQQSLGAIYKEGGGVKNFAFLTGLGNAIMAQQADTGDDNVQAYGDIKLTPNRPYHICFRMTYLENPQEFRFFIDGEEQGITEGNPLTSAGDHMDNHSGDINWGDPDSNLEMGGTDVAFAGQELCYYAHWATWSDNSPTGALHKTNDIRDDLFRRGAPPDTIIEAGTHAAMQTDLDGSADSVIPDWPLGIRVESPSSGGADLELVADNVTFNSRCTLQLEWRGTGTLTWVNENGSNLVAGKAYASNGGTITIIEAPPVLVNVKTVAGVNIQSARVLLEADTGGPLPAGESVTIVRSGSVATVTHTAHGMETGRTVAIRGANQADYNGLYSITVTGANTYTYTVSGTPTTPATGTITSTAVIIDGTTDVNGQITVNHRYSTNQPVTGRVRSATGATFYQTGTVTGTIVATGLDVTVLLVGDQ